MYVARAPRHPRCRASRLLSALGFPDSSSPRGNPSTDGRGKHCGTSPLPTPAHALRLLSSIPLHVNGTAGSRITPLGSSPHGGSYLSQPARFLLDRRSPTTERATAPVRPTRVGVAAAFCAALALPLAAPERPSSRNVGRTPDVQPSGVEVNGRRTLRRGSEASHRGDTERPCGMGARHNDEHQPHPCHRRRPHRDARPGWDGVDRVRGPCKGRARRRRLAGRNRGRRLDRDEFLGRGKQARFHCQILIGATGSRFNCHHASSTRSVAGS